LRFERRWHPFLLNPDMPPGGVPRSEYRLRKFGSAERSAALDARVAAEGAKEGLTFRFDRIARTPDTRDSHRLIAWGMASGAAWAGAADAVKERVMRAYFEEGEDIGDRAVLARLAGEVGLDARAAAAMLGGEEGRAAMEAAAARAAGIGGVPAVVLGNQVVVHGAQPAAEVVAILREAVGAQVAVVGA
jgi:predicted DsbA family dithiol-disulfide isomerase